jgi:hypothetical protein
MFLLVPAFATNLDSWLVAILAAGYFVQSGLAVGAVCGGGRFRRLSLLAFCGLLVLNVCTALLAPFFYFGE